MKKCEIKITIDIWLFVAGMVIFLVVGFSTIELSQTTKENVGLEFECDQWEQTGNTLIKEGKQTTWYLVNDTWYKEKPKDAEKFVVYKFQQFCTEEEYKLKEGEEIAMSMYDESMDWCYVIRESEREFNTELEAEKYCQKQEYPCSVTSEPVDTKIIYEQTPYQEQVCVHEKVTGRKTNKE